MKVLDLQCAQQHQFEGWFGSEEDYLSQCEGALVACPVCGDTSVSKRLSVPRLNLGASAARLPQAPAPADTAVEPAALQAAWFALARRVIAHTDDVGDRFAEEARKIHYGEVQRRGIRGQASSAEVQSLLEEGIAVQPLPLPLALKEPLQ